jgi:hypothetical protein
MPNLPNSTDTNLLSAIPHMKPWPEASANNRWVLREPGKQMLIYTGDNAPLDLSRERGSFKLNIVDPKTGKVTAGGIMKGGSKTVLPNTTLIWLTTERL